jgi:thiol-disulfide isomerase/thioredoxin
MTGLQGARLTPFRKGLLIGSLIGFAGAIVLVVGGFAVLVVVASRMAERGGAPGIALHAPEMPAGEQLTIHGSADWDWALRGPDGEELTLGDFRGRPIVLNVWATWCPPCRAEMPSLDRLAALAPDAGFAVVVVSEEDAETVHGYAEDEGLTLELYTAETPPPPAFASRGIPATFVIDPEGYVVFQHLGAADWSDESFLRFLGELAREEAG